MVIRKNTLHFSSGAGSGALSRNISRVDLILSRLNNSILNPSATANHINQPASDDLAGQSERNVRRATRPGANRFRLTRKQAIAEASSLFSKVSKRYL